MDELLNNAKQLVHRLHVHDGSVDSLVGEAVGLQGKLNAMKQYRSGVSQLNDIGNQKPKSTLILGEQLENQRIRDLEQENHELHVSLAEHQSALVLIMKKYREQVVALLRANGLDKNIFDCVNSPSEDSGYVKDTIDEMKAMVRASIKVDDEADVKLRDLVHRLQCENQTLRELLNISHSSSTAQRRKPKKPVAREERKIRKTLSLPLDDSPTPGRSKGVAVANRLKFRSSAFNHKDASQLLFPGLSPVDKEFSPKSLGAWIKSEELHHKTDHDESPRTTNSEANEGRTLHPKSRLAGDSSNGPTSANEGENGQDKGHGSETGENGRDATLMTEDMTYSEQDVLSSDHGSAKTPEASSAACPSEDSRQRRNSLTLNGSGGDGQHMQAIVFENATEDLDNDTIVYDISYELSGSDEEEDDGTAFVDDVDPDDDDDSDSSDGDSQLANHEADALSELDEVVQEFENEDTDEKPGG